MTGQRMSESYIFLTMDNNGTYWFEVTDGPSSYKSELKGLWTAVCANPNNKNISNNTPYPQSTLWYAPDATRDGSLNSTPNCHSHLSWALHILRAIALTPTCMRGCRLLNEVTFIQFLPSIRERTYAPPTKRRSISAPFPFAFGEKMYSSRHFAVPILATSFLKNFRKAG